MQALILALLLVSSQQDVAEISADRQTYQDGVWTATGDVVVTYRDMRFEADSIVYDETTGDLDADGDVDFTRGAEVLRGTRMDINLDTRVGVLFEASGTLGPGFIIEAAEARRLEDGRYELIDATVTTCDESGHRGWSFHTRRAVVDPDADVSATNSIFRLAGVPVFYMPYISTPVESKPRSSGFLTPQTSTSTTKGRSIGESFYYVINRSADLTVTGEYFTLRGLAGAVDFRAVPNASSTLEINTFFARDRQDQGGWSARILTATERGRLRAVADMNLVSSFVFRQVFEEGFDLISSPTERSRAFVSYNTPAASYNALYTRQGTFFVNQPTSIVRKLPSIDMSVHSRSIGGLPVYFSFDGSLAGLHRRDRRVDTPGFVSRLDLFPRIEVPLLRGPAFTWSHRLGVRETLYSHSRRPRVERDTLSRLAFDYGFEFTGPALERNYGRWRHVFEPLVEYRYISGVDRFHDTIRVDDVDLFTDTNEVRYGITNRFFTDREILSWTLSQKYFRDPTFGGALLAGRDNVFDSLLDVTGFGFADQPRRFSPLVSLVRFSPTPGTTTDLQIDYDTIRNQYRSAGITGGYRPGPMFFNVAYFFTRRSPIQLPSNQVRSTIGYGNSTRRGINGAVSFAYNIDQSFFQASTAQVSYNTDCYGLHVEFMQFDVGPRRESRIRFSFSLKHLGSIGTLRRQDRLF